MVDKQTKNVITKQEVKDIIVTVVRRVHGCRHVELLPKIVRYMDRYMEDEDLVNALFEHDTVLYVQELVQENRLAEIKYTIPNMPCKSFLLPVNTEVSGLAGCSLV